jgi:TonB family protein
MITTLKTVALILGLLATGFATGTPALSAEPQARTATKKVKPVYPEIARKGHLTGTVKLTVTVTPEGKVTTVEVIGGHPVFVVAASTAAKQWEFAPAAKPSSETLVFEFQAPR